MASDLERISAIWREQSSTYCEQLTDDILANAGPSYTSMARDQMLVVSRLVVNAWQTAFDTNDSAPIREFARQIGRRRAESHVVMDDIMRVVDIIRAGIWQVLARAYEGGDRTGAQMVGYHGVGDLSRFVLRARCFPLY